MSEIMRSGGGNDIAVLYGDSLGRPKNVIDAISALENMSALLGDDEEIPEHFFTLKQKLEFFEVGFRDSFIYGMVSALFTPIAMGVLEKIIPVFGDARPTLFDKVFVFVLAVGFSIGYALLVAGLGKFYTNKVTKTAIKNFFAGLFAGTLLKILIVFIGFHFIYFFILTPSATSEFLVRLLGFFKISPNSYVYWKIYSWLMEFREVFIPSAYFVVFTGLLFISIPTFSIIYYRWKYREIREDLS